MGWHQRSAWSSPWQPYVNWIWLIASPHHLSPPPGRHDERRKRGRSPQAGRRLKSEKRARKEPDKQTSSQTVDWTPCKPAIVLFSVVTWKKKPHTNTKTAERSSPASLLSLHKVLHAGVLLGDTWTLWSMFSSRKRWVDQHGGACAAWLQQLLSEALMPLKGQQNGVRLNC